MKISNSFFVKELAASIVFVVLLVLFLNPLYMPSTYSMMLILALIVVFAVFASFVWKERARDEREALHRHLADRDAFLIGTLVLVIGVIVQSIRHEPDPWLVATLGVMIIAKIIGIVRAQVIH